MPLKVNEIFYSIQGESIDSGRPCVFVRLTGCNLRCNYCDTRYAYHQGSPMTLPEIAAKIREFDCRLVEITGGEPLLQPETPQLILQLLEKRFRVLLETNGSLDVGPVDPRCVKIMDVKCPGSGEETACDMDNFNRLDGKDQVKFVICDRNDYDYSKKIIKRLPVQISPGNILLSPVSDKLKMDELAQWVLSDNLTVRLQIQMHKIIWPDVDRGV